MQGRLPIGRVIFATIALIALTFSLPAEARNCVRYARMLTGMQISGDAWTWWDGAAGVYARSQRPAPGAVLVFRRTGRLHYGHVATVSRVIDRRTVQVDHNWDGNESLRRGMRVVDISAHNDWSAVRVWSDYADALGNSVYPTYGFVLPHGAGRPGLDGGLMNADWTPGVPSLSRAPRGRSVLQVRELPVFVPSHKPLLREAAVTPAVAAPVQVATALEVTSAVEAWVLAYQPRHKPGRGETVTAAVVAPAAAVALVVAEATPTPAVAAAPVVVADAGGVVVGPLPRHKPGIRPIARDVTQLAALPSAE